MLLESLIGKTMPKLPMWRGLGVTDKPCFVRGRVRVVSVAVGEAVKVTLP